VPRTAAEVHTLVCAFVYVFNLYCDMILFCGSPCYSVRNSLYVARNSCGCPACASSADVNVRKCHGTLGEYSHVMGSHGACIDSYCRGNLTSFCGI